LRRAGIAASLIAALVLLALSCQSPDATPPTVEPTPAPTYPPFPQPSATPSGALPLVPDPFQLWVVDADGANLVQLASTAGGIEAAWSPVGGRLAYTVHDLVNSELHVLEPGVGPAAEVKIDGFARAPVWSPNGEQMAFVVSSADETSLDVMNADGSGLAEMTRVDAPGGYMPIVGWPSEDRVVAVIADVDRSRIVEFDVDSGEQRPLSEWFWGPDMVVPDISPDGETLVAGIPAADGHCSDTSPDIRVIELQSREARPVLEGVCGVSSVAWSPNGEEVAYTITGIGSGDDGAYVVDTVGRETRRLSDPGPEFDRGVEWLSDGSAVLVHRSPSFVLEGGFASLVLIPMDGSAERPLVDSAPEAVSSDGRTVAFEGNGLELIRSDGTARRVLVPADPDWEYASMQWSPEGGRVAFVRRHNRDLARRFEVDVDGTKLTRLADRSREVQLSPDGRRIAFQRRVGDSDTYELFLADADGASQVKVEVVDPGFSIWSPDSRRLVIGAAGPALYAVDADGTGLRKLGQALGSAEDIVWSPDGNKVAVHLRIMDVDTGAITELRSSLVKASWTADSQRIAFLDRQEDGQLVAFLAAADGSSTTPLGPIPGAVRAMVSPDGGSIAFVRRPDEDRRQVVVLDAQTLEERVVFEDEPHGWSVDEHPIWSPDGARLALVPFASWTPGLYIINANGSGWYQLVSTLGTDVVDVRWLDGTRLFFETAYLGPG